jgi:MFS family permease
MQTTTQPSLLGLRIQWRQFSLLLLVNACVGALMGLERSIMPTLAADVFHIDSALMVLSFIVSFGVVKACANLVTGRFADIYGRRHLLLIGWLLALPIPWLIIAAPNWTWIVFANLLLGVQQGLCWSAAVIMKIDLVGPSARGTATGLNEFTGYGAMALSSMLTGWLAVTYGPRPIPFYAGVAYIVIGALVSLLWVRETRQYATNAVPNPHIPMRFSDAFAQMSWRVPALQSLSLAGLVNNLNDVVVWGILPVMALRDQIPLEQIASIGGVYLGSWGVGQLVVGPLSDRYGRKSFIFVGLVIQSVGIALFLVPTIAIWSVAALCMGIGTALVYPTLLAAVSDAVPADWRGTGLGIYRFWRDSGYAIGAICAGVVTDLWGIQHAIACIAVVTAGAAVQVWWRNHPSPSAYR